MINEEEIKRTIVAKISPYITVNPVLASAINVDEIASKAILAFYELETTLEKRVVEAERRLQQAQADLAKAKLELELRTSNPEKFIIKTAEEITLMKMEALRRTLLKQRRAFEDGASSILKRSIKTY